MKIKFHFLACVVIPFFLVACANNSSDDSSSTVDLFASPKTVIENLDTDLSIESSSSRTAIPVSSIYEQKNSESTSKRLSGDVSTTQCILKMTKKEIAEAIGELKFNEKFTPESPVAGNYNIENGEVTVKLSAFEVTHEAGTNVAYIYSSVNVVIEGMGEPQFDSVLKCTTNTKGTLDTELFMTGGNENLYTKFTCSESQKIKKELKTSLAGDLKSWDDIKITKNEITGYKYRTDKDKESSFYVDQTGYVTTFYDEERGNDRGKTSFICQDSDGQVILQKYTDSNTEEATWCYNVNWIANISDYVIVTENSNYYLKENENAEAKNLVFMFPEDENDESKNIYTISETNMSGTGMNTLTCKVNSSIITRMKEAESNFEYPAEDTSIYITPNNFTAELKTNLTEWLNSLSE